MRSQTRRLKQDSSALVRDAPCDMVEEPIVIYESTGKCVVERVERDLEEGTQTFRTLLAGEHLSSRPGGPIGKHRSLVEAESQSYHAACDSTHRDIWIDAMRQELQGYVKIMTLALAELPAGRKPISAKRVFAWNTDQMEITRGKVPGGQGFPTEENQLPRNVVAHARFLIDPDCLH